MTTKNEIAVFTKTQKDLIKFKEDFVNVPDASTKDGYAFIKSACSELKTARTSVEKARKAEKQAYIDAGKNIDKQAKGITAQIVELEEPMKAAKEAQDNIEAIRKAERLAHLRGEINKISNHVDLAKGKSSIEILEVVELVEAIETAAGYYDLTAEATQARAETLTTLNDMYTNAFSFEVSERQRIEAEAAQKAAEEAAAEIQRKADEEAAEAQRKADELQATNDRKKGITDRLTKLQLTPNSLFISGSHDVERALKAIKKYEVTAGDFDDRYEEAVKSQTDVIVQLERMLAMVKIQEKSDYDNEARRMKEEEANRIEAEVAAAEQQAIIDEEERLKAEVIEATKPDPVVELEPDYNEALCNELKQKAFEIHRMAEQAWHNYAKELPIGNERIKAFEIYENTRHALLVN